MAKNTISRRFNKKNHILMVYLLYCFFVYGTHHLKKVLDLFQHNFDESIILLLHQIGLNFILALYFTGYLFFL
jgi:hypothetical protein